MASATATAVIETGVQSDLSTFISDSDYSEIVSMDRVVSGFRTELARQDVGDMVKFLVQARAINAIQKMMTPKIMQDVMTLMDNPLGFKTDRPPGFKFNKQTNKYEPNKRYDEETVKRCVIVALLSGAQLVGNQFNIIAGNCYLTKSFSLPAIKSFPGLTDFSYTLSAPTTYGDKTAAVSGLANWKVNGVQYELQLIKTDQLDARIIVNRYDSSSPDEIRGKAEAKLFQRVLARLNGLNLPLDSQLPTDDHDAIEGQVTRSELLPPVALPTSDEPAEDDVTESAEIATEETNAGPSDRETAENLLAAARAEFALLNEINKVKASCDNSIELIRTQAEWHEDLVHATVDQLTQAADERIAEIRAARGK